jgi:hypothetical protein
MEPGGSETPVKDLTAAQLADEYAEVRLRMMAWKPNVNTHAQRFAQLVTELLSRQAEEPADKLIQVQGDRYIVPISPQENRSKITDAVAVYRAVRRLGLKQFLEAYTITLTAARKLLTSKQQEKWIETARTGPREIREPVLREARQA